MQAAWQRGGAVGVEFVNGKAHPVVEELQRQTVTGGFDHQTALGDGAVGEA